MGLKRSQKSKCCIILPHWSEYKCITYYKILNLVQKFSVNALEILKYYEIVPRKKGPIIPKDTFNISGLNTSWILGLVFDPTLINGIPI
jgi:hypothetical protein